MTNGIDFVLILIKAKTKKDFDYTYKLTVRAIVDSREKINENPNQKLMLFHN